MKDLGAAVEHATRVATLLPNNQMNLRILVAALMETGRLDARLAAYRQPAQRVLRRLRLIR